jgi:glycine betaine/proline transport system ATP-binding protein
VTLNGREGRIATTNVETGAVATDGYDMIVAPVELTLRAAIALKSQTDHPILLVDQLGRLAGLCGDEEIYRGLLRKQS